MASNSALAASAVIGGGESDELAAPTVSNQRPSRKAAALAGVSFNQSLTAAGDADRGGILTSGPEGVAPAAASAGSAPA
eukprot:7372410-Alexandrium_andersonii.AAC.1